MKSSIKILVFALAIAQLFALAQEATSKCACPRFIVVSNLQEVKAGEVVEFRVYTDDQLASPKFEWEISKGTIVSGQGTAKIRVQTSADMVNPAPTPISLPSPDPTDPHGYVIIGAFGRGLRTSITATARYVGEADCSCPSASAVVQVGTQSGMTNRVADVTRIKLSTGNVAASCEPGQLPATGSAISPTMIVDVNVSAVDPDEDVLTYNYEVSGGRIVGQGAHVTWDLTGIEPGRYTITAAVDDGCGLCGASKTEEVAVVACSTVDIACPTISITGPDNLKPKNVAAFTANVSGGTQESVTYTWTVRNAEIVSGQGSPFITVKTPSDFNGKHVSLSVKIAGLDPRGNCLDSATKEFHNGRAKP